MKSIAACSKLQVASYGRSGHAIIDIAISSISPWSVRGPSVGGNKAGRLKSDRSIATINFKAIACKCVKS